METDCECLFCQRNDLNLYEINQNSVLIGPSLVDFQDIIFSLFYARANNDVTNFICEECKDLLTQFYVFKANSKQNLNSFAVIESLKKFLDDSVEAFEPTVEISEKTFTVTFVGDELKDEIVAEIAEDFFEVVDEPMALDEEEDAEQFELESVKEEDSEVSTAVELITPKRKVKIFETETIEEIESQSEDTSKRTYKCHCGVVTFSAQELTTHMKKHKQTIPHKPKASRSKLNCCGVDFKEVRCFRMHEKAHENFEAIAPYLPVNMCLQCRVVYSQEDDLEQHLSTHSPDDETIQFEIISKKSAFEDHMVMTGVSSIMKDEFEDPNDTRLNCGHCGKKFYEAEMKVHLLFFHTSFVTCPFDNRVFDGAKQIRLFSEHVRNKHPEVFNNDNIYQCRLCNGNFATLFEKLAHMRKCDSKPFLCEGHCSKRFATEWLLKSHLKFVKGDKTFACDKCGKRCVSRSDLQIHHRSHTNERPYECPICKKFFKTSANRSSHMDIHEGEKRHECEICGEKFQTRPILRKHKKRHDSEYLEECACKICQKRYATKPHLLRHLKAEHKAGAEMSSGEIKEFFDDYFQLEGGIVME